MTQTPGPLPTSGPLPNPGLPAAIIRLEFVLPCPAEAAWEALHSAQVFRSVYAPVLVMRGDLPDRFSDGLEAVVAARGFGIIPLGRQRLRIRDIEPPATSRPLTRGTTAARTMLDVGRPVSGPLRFITTWHHAMTITAAGANRCVWREELRFTSPIAWAYRPGLAILWAWRARRIRARLAR